jgi:hypothetical protein
LWLPHGLATRTPVAEAPGALAPLVLYLGNFLFEATVEVALGVMVAAIRAAATFDGSRGALYFHCTVLGCTTRSGSAMARGCGDGREGIRKIPRGR